MTDENANTKQQDTPDKTPKPGNVCTVHIMFPTEGVKEAAAVASALEEVTKGITGVVTDFRVSDARIAPSRIRPNG